MAVQQARVMSQRSNLGKQIVLTTGLVSVITTLIVFVGSFILYDLMFAFDPPPGPPDSLFPQAPDYLIFAVVALCGLIVAVLIALRLARRILAPLNSLAEGARRIAAGDLTARAIPGDRSLGETARMVDDFNSMAMKLEDMVGNMAAWNAAIAHELRMHSIRSHAPKLRARACLAEPVRASRSCVPSRWRIRATFDMRHRPKVGRFLKSGFRDGRD